MLYLCQLLSLRGAHYCGEGEEFGLGATFVDRGSCSAKRAIRIAERDRLTCISWPYYSRVVEGFIVTLKLLLPANVLTLFLGEYGNMSLNGCLIIKPL